MHSCKWWSLLCPMNRTTWGCMPPPAGLGFGLPSHGQGNPKAAAGGEPTVCCLRCSCFCTPDPAVNNATVSRRLALPAVPCLTTPPHSCLPYAPGSRLAWAGSKFEWLHAAHGSTQCRLRAAWLCHRMCMTAIFASPFWCGPRPLPQPLAWHRQLDRGSACTIIIQNAPCMYTGRTVALGNAGLTAPRALVLLRQMGASTVIPLLWPLPCRTIIDYGRRCWRPVALLLEQH